MQVLAEDGARIDARISGNKRSRAVVLIHGFPLTRAIWEVHADALAESYYAIVPDLRGAGASSVSQGPYLMETHAADVATLLDALGVERVALVGHSMGGYVAMAFARMFAERVNAIALVASRLRDDTPQEAATRNALAVRVESENSIEPVVSAYLPRLLSERTRRELPAVTKCAYAIARGNSPAGVAATLRGIAMRAPADDIAGDLDVPALVVAGGQDAVVPVEESEAVAATFARGRLAVCPKSGHLPMLEEPELALRALSEWLGGSA